ncbi:hypothetical protein GGQ87_002019 [Brevundimonas alba]|uniref:DNA gyrase inhibitor YacG n=2 Tax=Brevundimonas alba TaxID=74314 RepID=A0A7X5YMA0_9CAUL|nr:hypothetical protein [Brevundimonas alba]
MKAEAMATCPNCRRQPADPKYKPFCSKRCADVDLQRWFTGGYVIPGPLDETPPDDDGEG